MRGKITELLMMAISNNTIISIHCDTKTSVVVTCSAMYILNLPVDIVKAAGGNRDNTVLMLHATAKERRPDRTTASIPLTYSFYPTHALTKTLDVQ